MTENKKRFDEEGRKEKWEDDSFIRDPKSAKRNKLKTERQH
jgi:hypothetical protein